MLWLRHPATAANKHIATGTLRQDIAHLDTSERQLRLAPPLPTARRSLSARNPAGQGWVEVTSNTKRNTEANLQLQFIQVERLILGSPKPGLGHGSRQRDLQPRRDASAKPRSGAVSLGDVPFGARLLCRPSQRPNNGRTHSRIGRVAAVVPGRVLTLAFARIAIALRRRRQGRPGLASSSMKPLPRRHTRSIPTTFKSSCRSGRGAEGSSTAKRGRGWTNRP